MSNSIFDTSNSSGYIKIAENRSSKKPIEFPLEKDNTILLSKLRKRFGNATGLEYLNPENRIYRQIDLNEDNALCLPSSGWNDHIYFCTYANRSRMFRRQHSKNNVCNLVIWSLPSRTKETDLRQYFCKFGQVIKVDIKHAFGFVTIRLYSLINLGTLLDEKHSINGGNCRIRLSPEGNKKFEPMKLYIRMYPRKLNADDLIGYFSRDEYEFIDIHIPCPDKNFAFVTYMDKEKAKSLCGRQHFHKGTNIIVEKARMNKNVSTQNFVQTTLTKVYECIPRDVRSIVKTIVSGAVIRMGIYLWNLIIGRSNNLRV